MICASSLVCLLLIYTLPGAFFGLCQGQVCKHGSQFLGVANFCGEIGSYKISYLYNVDHVQSATYLFTLPFVVSALVHQTDKKEEHAYLPVWYLSRSNRYNTSVWSYKVWHCSHWVYMLYNKCECTSVWVTGTCWGHKCACTETNSCSQSLEA